MSTIQKYIVAGLAILAILGTLAFFGITTGGSGSGSSKEGIVAGSINNGAEYYNYPYWFGNGLYSGSQQQWAVTSTGNMVVSSGETFTQGSLNSEVISGTCNAGAYAASSTLFAIANPFNATSTATFDDIYGTGQATTSQLLVGTSTLSSGLASTNVSASFINNTTMANSVATSSAFYFAPGTTAGSGAGFSLAGGANMRTIQVGPSDFVVGYASSTATGGGATSYVPGIGCTYNVEFKH